MLNPPAILVISGIDPANGAGMGRDIATIREIGGHPLSIPSVLTVQNSMKFYLSQPVSIEYVTESINILEYEFQFSAIKTGLLPLENDWISSLSRIFDKFTIPVVIDPVFKATSDGRSENVEIPDSYIPFISGAGKFITPNLKELELIHIKMFKQIDFPYIMAENISKRTGCSIITTFEGKEPFITVTEKEKHSKINIELFETERSIHGTGCTFSSALAVNLGKGLEIINAVKSAADYTLGKIRKSVIYNNSGQYYLF